MELSATTAALSANSINAADKSAAAQTTDYETFLKMMTTQLKNQDPLNPIDSADYAVQLATFSGVEQQTRTNKLLEGLQTQFGILGMAQMAGWVGNQARAAMPVWLDGDPVSLSPNSNIAANRTVLVVRDAEGTTVNRIDLPSATTSLDWTPVNIEGTALPSGQYSFQLENYKGEEVLPTTDVEAYAQIMEIRGGTAGMTLVMSGGIEVPLAQVTALRD